MEVYTAAPPFARSLYANGILFAMLGIPLALAGVAAGFALDFWWVLWVGLAISALGVFLWLAGSIAIAPIYGSLFTFVGIALGSLGLFVGATGGFWWLLWIGIGMVVASVLARFCVIFLIALDDR